MATPIRQRKSLKNIMKSGRKLPNYSRDATWAFRSWYSVSTISTTRIFLPPMAIWFVYSGCKTPLLRTTTTTNRQQCSLWWSVMNWFHIIIAYWQDNFRFPGLQARTVQRTDRDLWYRKLCDGSYVSQQPSNDEEIFRVHARRLAGKNSRDPHLQHCSFLPFGDGFDQAFSESRDRTKSTNEFCSSIGLLIFLFFRCIFIRQTLTERNSIRSMCQNPPYHRTLGAIADQFRPCTIDWVKSSWIWENISWLRRSKLH